MQAVQLTTMRDAMRYPFIIFRGRVHCIKLLLVLLVSCLLTSCVRTLRTPLLDESNSAIDEALLGVWWTVEGERLEIKRGESKKTLVIGRGDEREQLRTASFDDLSIITIPFSRDGDHLAYDVAKYRVSPNGNVQFFLLNEHKIAEAIETEKLAGKVVRNQVRGLFRSEFKSVEIDDTAENILEFLRKNADDAFSKDPLITLTRETPDRDGRSGSRFKLPVK
jgi:hypothetical protein